MGSTVPNGSVLVLVLAVLSLLSVVATAMASLQGTARQESARYIEKLEASLLAQSGIERAIAELKRNPFRGFEYNDMERETWNAEPEYNTPLEEATHPSYYYTESPIINKQSPERRTWNVDLEELITKEPKLISIHDPRSTLNDLQVGK